jgi:hypothetical protein
MFGSSPEWNDGSMRSSDLVYDLICEVPAGHPHFAVVGCCLMNRASTTLIWHAESSGRWPVPSVAVDAAIEEIGPGCFSDHFTPTITFLEPSRLRSIGKRAFENCLAFCFLVIPSSVEVIGERAFDHCHSLQEVRFKTGSRLQLIEQSAFTNCAYLQPVDVPSRATIQGRYKVLARVRDVDGSRRTRVEFVTIRMRY